MSFQEYGRLGHTGAGADFTSLVLTPQCSHTVHMITTSCRAEVTGVMEMEVVEVTITDHLEVRYGGHLHVGGGGGVTVPTVGGEGQHLGRVEGVMVGEGVGRCRVEVQLTSSLSFSSVSAVLCPPLLLLLLVLLLELLLAVEAEAVVLRPGPGELLVGGGW